MTTATKAKLLEFAGQIARLTDESEIVGGMVSEDAIATVNDLIAEARKLTGIDPGYPKVHCPICDTPVDECECEAPGECLTCGTQCDQDGICPLCAALERAMEQRRTAVGAAAQVAAERDLFDALRAPIDSCRKCGKPLSLIDVVEPYRNACTDEGEGEEAGRVFVYCSSECRETH